MCNTVIDTATELTKAFTPVSLKQHVAYVYLSSQLELLWPHSIKRISIGDIQLRGWSFSMIVIYLQHILPTKSLAQQTLSSILERF